MTWFGICVTYIRFYQGFKHQGFDRSKLPYASKLQPYAAYYGAIASWLICFVSPPLPLFKLVAGSKRSNIHITVQRMESVPQRWMGYSHLCDQLHAVHLVSYPVCRLETQDQGPHCESGQYGLCYKYR